MFYFFHSFFGKVVIVTSKTHNSCISFCAFFFCYSIALQSCTCNDVFSGKIPFWRFYQGIVLVFFKFLCLSSGYYFTLREFDFKYFYIFFSNLGIVYYACARNMYSCNSSAIGLYLLNFFWTN